MFDAAYEEYFSGRVGVDDWLRQREADLDNARDALRWARSAGEAAVELRIGTTLLRALPPSLHVERMALADACEARLGPTVPDALQLRAWIELSCVLADSQKARGRHAAEAALALARRLDARETDRFVLYHALCRAASAAAQAGDLAVARPLLAESQRLEDPSWPAQRLIWGTEAAQWFARMSGDSVASLQRGRRLLSLDRERGSHAAIAIGNLIDAELAAGDARAAALLGSELIESLRGTPARVQPRVRPHQPARRAAGAGRRGTGPPGRARRHGPGPRRSTCSMRPPPTWPCSARSRAGPAPRSSWRRTRRRSTRRAKRHASRTRPRRQRARDRSPGAHSTTRRSRNCTAKALPCAMRRSRAVAFAADDCA